MDAVCYVRMKSSVFCFYSFYFLKQYFAAKKLQKPTRLPRQSAENKQKGIQDSCLIEV